MTPITSYWNATPSGPVQNYDPQFTPCVQVDDPDDPDLFNEVVKPKCSELCEKNNDYPDPTEGGFDPVCLDENWSMVEWDANYVQCPNPTPLLDVGAIEDVLGVPAAEDAEELPCNLADTCLELLAPNARHAMSVPDWPSVRDTAEDLMETDSAQVSALEILGQDTDVIGQAAYTAVNCGEAACPFYLAQLDLEATTPLTVSVTYSSTTIAKIVSDIAVSLERPALGLWLPDTGDVIFPNWALAIRVNASVVGSTNAFGENGNYDRLYYPQDYIFGSIDAGVFTISAGGEDVLGAWWIEGNFVPE